MNDYVFGANIIENLTTGMYQDSKVIYREYIQNSCDQIDKAVRAGILSPREGVIEIWIDTDSRTISIEDNATGIPAADFRRVLGNIADSDKKIGEDKGFRGIGRLCGLAYCKKVVFTSSAKGEKTESVLICDATKMRSLIVENGLGKKHTATEVLNAINEFHSRQIDDANSHYFRVELVGINDENTDLLNKKQVLDYLSFVAPVPYHAAFIYRTEIYSHAKAIGHELGEYCIRLEGETIFKRYETVLRDSNTGKKYDDIFGVEFKDFYDSNHHLVAWMWLGLSQFRKAIPKVNKMRGFRLRKQNIQIGGEDALQKLFKEDRGNSYFVGEVFAVSRDLIPNSQRDYFNENPARAGFEKKLRLFFNDELRRVYYGGSVINSAYKKIDDFEQKHTDYLTKESGGLFVDVGHQEDELQIVESAKREASTAKAKIEREKEKADESNPLMRKVIERIETSRGQRDISELRAVPVKFPESRGTTKRRTDSLSSYNKKERKLIGKILSIIYRATDSVTAQAIIDKIEDELK